jgi:hypothetical protein
MERLHAGRSGLPGAGYHWEDALKLVFAVAAVWGLSSGLAQAQTDAPPAPQPGTLATIHESHAQDALGDSRYHQSTTYRDAQGVTRDSRTSTRTVAVPPLPPPVTTSTSTATETTTSPR